jgi:hydrogenase nickel incorporation protein HypA/HybF
MHELSIAENIIEIIENTVKENSADKVTLVEIEIGEMSGVLIDSLKLALEISVKGTVIENTEVKIYEIGGETQCNSCNNIFPIHDLYTPCPECESYDNKIIKGNEMKIKSITLEED